METRYLFRLVLSNGTRKMIASPIKTRNGAWTQALVLMEALKATNVEIWETHNYTLVMEIESK